MHLYISGIHVTHFYSFFIYMFFYQFRLVRSISLRLHPNFGTRRGIYLHYLLNQASPFPYDFVIGQMLLSINSYFPRGFNFIINFTIDSLRIMINFISLDDRDAIWQNGLEQVRFIQDCTVSIIIFDLSLLNFVFEIGYFIRNLLFLLL